MSLPHDCHLPRPLQPDLERRQRELRLRLDEARSTVTLLERELAGLQQPHDQEHGPHDAGFPLPVAAG